MANPITGFLTASEAAAQVLDPGKVRLCGIAATTINEPQGAWVLGEDGYYFWWWRERSYPSKQCLTEAEQD